MVVNREWAIPSRLAPKRRWRYFHDMVEIGVVEAKKRLSELLRRASAGEEIAITSRGRVVARRVPPAPAADREQARAAAARLRERRKGVTLGGLEMKGLIAKGRK